MEKLKKRINNNGERLTKQRKIILNYLQSIKNHPDAEKIYNKVKKEISNISLGTIYRNLKHLVEKNLIIQLNTIDNKTHFDGNINYHAHFNCIICKKIYDIFKIKKEINSEIQKIGEVYKTEYNIYGCCNKCKK